MPSAASRQPRRRFPRLQAALGLALLIALAAWGIFTRWGNEQALAKKAQDSQIPTVQLVAATAGPAAEEVILPGTVQPFIEAPIYARTSGYVKEWYTDIGTPVKKGQILALLDTPEVDQQLHQAEADYATAQANEALALSTAKRWAALLATDSVSKQENDEKQADAQAKKALLASAKANLDRLRELEGFKRVIAPFDGVVTARQTDVGALINSGAAQGASLFRVTDNSRLRIYVQVPESYAPMITKGVQVQLGIAELPGKSFNAEVTRTAEAMDSASRSLQVEIQYNNEKHDILPGGYAQVHFHLPIAEGKPRLPVSALIFRADGLEVARLDEQSKAHLVKVQMGRDFGKEVEIASGINAGDHIIASPPDSLSDGDVVKIAETKDHKDANQSADAKGQK
jgi:RND family efflux transporter MFP subunit